jgi:hypothetical protein
MHAYEGSINAPAANAITAVNVAAHSAGFGAAVLYVILYFITGPGPGHKRSGVAGYSAAGCCSTEDVPGSYLNTRCRYNLAAFTHEEQEGLR